MYRPLRVKCGYFPVTQTLVEIWLMWWEAM